jgi:hypothetical protein
MAARMESPNYATGAKRIENAIPLLTGGLRKRPGTWNVKETEDNLPAILIDWTLSDGLELTVEVATLEAGLLFSVYPDKMPPIILDNPVYDVGHSISLDKLRYAAGKGIVPGAPDRKTERDFIMFTHPDEECLFVLNAVPNIPYDPDNPYRFTAVPFNLTGAAGVSRVKDIAFYGGRLYLAGLMADNGSPTRIMASRAPNSLDGTYRYNDFTAGSLAGDAIVIDENDMSGSGIQWVYGARRLLTATERASWEDTGEVPTPATFDMNIVEYAGAADLKPAASKEIVIYAGRDGKTLRALVWQYQNSGGGYMDIDLGQGAAHLFESGITSFAVMDYPFPVIWITTGEGFLVSCTPHIQAGVTAFARHYLGTRPGDATPEKPFYAFVENVQVFRRKDGDQVRMVVRRRVLDNNGVPVDKRFIERLEIENLVNEDYKESHYVDCGVLREFAPGQESDTIEGLGDLRGQYVNVFADGSLFPPVLVDNEGRIKLNEKIRSAHVGLPVETLVSLNTAQIPANGTSYGKKRRIEKVLLSLYKTIGGAAGTSLDKESLVITQRFGSYRYGEPVEPYTGNIELSVAGTVDTEGSLYLTHVDPTPFTVLAVVERIAILEG